jgi:hypothetical protein
MYLLRRTLLVVVALCMLFSFVAAVSVNPQTQSLTDPKDETYTFVYTVINNDPQPRTLAIRIEPNSLYMKDQVTFSKEQFALLPGQTENIQVTIHPHGLGPETHVLDAGVYDAQQKLDTIQLLIAVPGTPIEDYAMLMETQDTRTDAAVPVTIKIGNYGNIIGYARLLLEIQQHNATLGSVTYPEVIQVLPGGSVTYDLIYTETLEPGFYTARVTASFPAMNITGEDQFSVRLEETTYRLYTGEDLVLTFASLGNPGSIRYSLTDDQGNEELAGTFMPDAGDIVIPTNGLAKGDYTLTLLMPTGNQTMTILVREKIEYVKYGIFALVICIVLYAAYSYLPSLHRRYRLYRLERTVTAKQEQVTNLINRAHRLVDEYTAIHARRRQTNGPSGASDQRPR